jgi:drug/metabolite transporter (DMT)-like permease
LSLPPSETPAAERARLALILSAIGFGGTWVAAPWATDDIAPLVVAFIRFGVASILLFAWVRIRGIPIAAQRRDLPIVVGIALTSVVGYNICFLYGVTLAPASNGAVLVPGLIPVITLVLARMVFGERVHARQAIGAALSIGGLVLVVGPVLSADSRALAGDVLFLGSAVMWAIYSIIGRAATRRFPASVATLLGTSLGTLVLLPLAILGQAVDPHGVELTARALAGVLYLGSVGTVVSFVLFYEGVRLIGAARATAYTVLVPVFGLFLTTLLLAEPLGPLGIVGAAVVIGGLWLTQSRPARSEEVAASPVD